MKIPNESMSALGRHLLAEFYGCDFARLNDVELLRASCLAAVERSGATVVDYHFKVFQPHGVSGVVVIAESHLSFHTWPEHGYMALDFFTCVERVDVNLAVDLLAEELQPGRVHRSLHLRGSDLPSRAGKSAPEPSMKRVRIFSHHLYELKKGLRNLILFTTDQENQPAIERRLQSHRIAYLVCPVSHDSNRINVFFGNKTCIEVIKRFDKRYLSEFSAEEDFILGTMLGYARLKQCERYLRVKSRKRRA